VHWKKACGCCFGPSVNPGSVSYFRPVLKRKSELARYEACEVNQNSATSFFQQEIAEQQSQMQFLRLLSLSLPGMTELF
jgi:hypothetical protein